MAQELMTGKCEGEETKNSQWARAQVKILTKICRMVKSSNSQFPERYKGLTHIPMLFKLEVYSHQNPKRYPFHYRGLECKSRKSRDTWNTRQI